MSAPSMVEVLARWAYEAYDSHFNRHGLSWEDYKAADPGEAEHLYLSTAREQAQALAAAGFGHVASVEAHAETCERVAMAQAERAEAAEAVVARVQELYDAYMAWDGDPNSEFTSSSHQREQLRRALEG